RRPDPARESRLPEPAHLHHRRTGGTGRGNGDGGGGLTRNQANRRGESLMTVLLLVLALALIGATTALLARAAGQRRREAVAVVAEIGRYGFSSRHPHDGGRGSTAARTSLLPRFDLLAEQLGGIVSRRAGPEAAAEVAGLLRSAGIYRTSARKVLGYRVLLTLGLPVLW